MLNTVSYKSHRATQKDITVIKFKDKPCGILVTSTYTGARYVRSLERPKHIYYAFKAPQHEKNSIIARIKQLLSKPIFKDFVQICAKLNEIVQE